jgi:ubiquinone/menaquinone biosynthesis C-methylase UbiE
MVLLLVFVALLAVAVIAWWWRYRSLACPAGASWLLDNPLMNAIAGPEQIIQRLGLHEGMQLLDVGCGTGRLTLPAAERVGVVGGVTALDIQAEMLEKLLRRGRERQLGNIHPVHGGAGAGLLEPGYYDRALLVTVLGEIRNRDEALREIREALKPGGTLLVTEVLFDPHYLRQARVSSLCQRAGFREVETFRDRFSYSKLFVCPAE